MITYIYINVNTENDISIKNIFSQIENGISGIRMRENLGILGGKMGFLGVYGPDLQEILQIPGLKLRFLDFA